MDQQVLEILNHELGKKGISISQASEILDIERSGFNKFINGQRIPNIEVVIKIINFLFPDSYESYEILRLLVPDLHSFHSLKVMIEIARLNRDEETVTKIAGLLSQASTKKDKEWADFYLLWQNFRTGKLDKQSYLNSVLAIPLQSQELQALRNITLLHYYYTTSQQFETAIEYSIKAKTEIDALPNGLIKSSYLSRYYLYYGHLTMLKNYEPDETSIQYLEKSFEYALSSLVKGICLYNLGITFQYHDHGHACKYFSQAEIILRQCAKYDSSLLYIADYILDIAIPRSKVVANELDNIKEELKNPHVQIPYFIKMDNLTKAKEVLNNLTEEEKEDEFLLICAGIIERSIPLLFKALSRCIELNQINEATLAIQELVKLGIDQSIIDTIIQSKFGKNKGILNT